jgi:predicted membrane protein
MVLVARAADVSEFSTFAAVLTAAVVLTGLLRAFVLEPVLVRSPGTRHDLRRVGSEALSMAALTGVAASAVCLTIWALMGQHPIRELLLVLALVLPGMLLQDGGRYVLFAGMRHRAALINDVLWLSAMAAGFVVIYGSGQAVTATSALLIWGSAGSIAGLVALRQLRMVRPRAPWRLVAANADVAGHLLVQFLALTGAGYLSLFLLGVVQDLDALGAVRAVQLLFGPLSVVFMGVYVSMLPKGLEGGPGRLTGRLVQASAAFSGIVLVCSLIILLTPDSVGRALLGDTWDPASALVLPYAAYLLTVTCATGPSVGLTILERFRVLTAVRVGSIPLAMGVPIAAAARWGATGYVTAQAIVGACLVGVWWFALRRAVGDAIRWRPEHSRADVVEETAGGYDPGS